MKPKTVLAVVCLLVSVYLSVCIVKSLNSMRSMFDNQSELMIESIQSGLVEERVIHPNQLDLEDIHAGDILILIHEDGSQQKVLILKSPYFENGTCKFDTIVWENNAPKLDFVSWKSCADAGLVEYSVFGLSGWNPTNYIIGSGDPSLTPEQLEEVISNLREQETPEQPLQLPLENA